MDTMETQICDLQVCKQDTYQYTTEVEEHFKCTICLNLVYKPIVQSCGHIFCFWCVHRAMNPKKVSACVICRRPYLHFPRICALLHSFLLKAAPLAYADRARETEAMEESGQVYSPRTILISPKILKLQNFPSSTEASQHHCENARNEGASESRNLTSHDFPCALCHQLLYRPVVLKCGEVFCESCLKRPDSTFARSECLSCGCQYQGASINVCLELHHFLEAAFPLEYQERKLKSPMNTADSIECTTPPIDYTSCCQEGLQYEMVHEGVGCDSCGMYPILGARFQCKDCPEKVSYDLCGQCKEITPSFNEGRFNQNHKPDHHMEEVVIKNPHNHKQVSLVRISPAVAPLIFNLQSNATLQRQMHIHQEQQMFYDDLDDYIDCLV